MENVEIEKKYLVNRADIDFSLDGFTHLEIEQAYLATNPVVRIRRSDEDYYLTYKGSGMIKRTEYNLPLTKESYEHLREKADGKIITKTRYKIPYDEHIIELDIFKGSFEGLYLAEVEFDSLEDANNFNPPAWFGDDVTFDGKYHNSNMALS